jgi:hypothetical protein
MHLTNTLTLPHVSVKSLACELFKRDLHVVYTTIDIYTHNIGANPQRICMLAFHM